MYRLNLHGITDHYPCFALALLAWVEGGMVAEIEQELNGQWFLYSRRYLRAMALLTNRPTWEVA